jgi:hypothetical protein
MSDEGSECQSGSQYVDVASARNDSRVTVSTTQLTTGIYSQRPNSKNPMPNGRLMQARLQDEILP